MTILRRIMAVPTPPVGLVSQLGLDDWSFRRRKQFGAILVNLETHRTLSSLARPLGRHRHHLDAGASRNRTGKPGPLKANSRRRSPRRARSVGARGEIAST